MAQPNYQEPIEKEDLDMKKKFLGGVTEISKEPKEKDPDKKELKNVDFSEIKEGERVAEEKEIGGEGQEEKVSEKIETARRVISTQKAAAPSAVTNDAKSISKIDDYEKKVEKLIEIAIQKGPEHAIRIAQHIDKEKGGGQVDNYTLDEVHDRLMEDGLRNQLIQKGLLKEL